MSRVLCKLTKDFLCPLGKRIVKGARSRPLTNHRALIRHPTTLMLGFLRPSLFLVDKKALDLNLNKRATVRVVTTESGEEKERKQRRFPYSRAFALHANSPVAYSETLLQSLDEAMEMRYFT